MTKEETIEVLLTLKENLENDRHFFLCRILESINIPCTFLKDSGLEDVWSSNPERIIRNAWLFNASNYKGNYEQALKENKIECINILLKQLGHDN